MFNDNKMVAFIFKIVNKLDYIGMLAHLQNVDFSSLLVDLNDFHISLSCGFNGYSLTI